MTYDGPYALGIHRKEQDTAARIKTPPASRQMEFLRSCDFSERL
jgi:hypothetical protein